jgi:hypothetical protein
MQCVRRSRQPDDPFFDEGNAAFAERSKFWCCPAETLETVTGAERSGGQLMCHFASCSLTFRSLSALENHIFVSHRNRCSECGKDYPTLHLLEAHISETHDSFFAVLAEKKPSYVCFVEGCSHLSWNTAERQSHLIEGHLWPAAYFHLDKKRCTTRKVKGKKGIFTENMHVDMNEASSYGKQSRPSKTLCVFFLKNKCKRGAACRFRHEATGNEQDASAMTLEEDGVEQLSRAFSTVKFVPQSIRFGRPK